MPEKNKLQEEKENFIIKDRNKEISTRFIQNQEYRIIILIDDSLMPNKERILIFDFKSPVQLLNEWKDALISISYIIKSVIQWIKVNLENKRLILELRKTSEIDKLTNVYNRLMLDKILLKQKESYDKYKEKCSVIIMDIDFFKRVNDNYGHNAGDKVLFEIATLIKNNINNNAVVGRWGGEEFLIIYKCADLSEAVNLSECLRKNIEGYSFTGVGNITASFGVSEFSGKNSIEQIIGKADKALYKSKSNGRNMVSSYID